MEIPLSLRERRDGSLTYGIPLWYRVFCAVMLLFIIGAIAVSDAPLTVFAWVFIALCVAGALYEERWGIDTSSKTLRHSGGLYPVIKKTVIGFGDIECMLLGAFAKGTVPGSREETEDKERAFEMMRGQDKDNKPKTFLGMGRRKPFITLLVVTKNGDSYLIDSLPARRASRLEKTGEKMAAVCGCPFRNE